MTSKILLVNPPKEVLVLPTNTTFQRSLPVGLSLIAASLRRAGHDVQIFDSIIYSEDNRPLKDFHPQQKKLIDNNPYHNTLFHMGASWSRIRKEIIRSKADLVGITSPMSTHSFESYKIAEIVKDIDSDIPVIMGGAHPTDLPHEALSDQNVDFVVLGEGDKSVVELTKAIFNNQDFTNIDGIGFKNSKKHTINQKREWIHDLDELPFPALDLLSLKRWFKKIGYRYTVLNTSRGCPFDCQFCSIHTVFGKRYRMRSPEKTIEEIEWCYDTFGINNFLIEDDNFTCNLNRIDKLCDLICQSGLDLSFYALGGISAVRVNEAILYKLKKAGFKDITYALESSNEAIKEKIRKPVTKTDVSNAVNISKKIGIEDLSVFIMAGLPDQTLNDVLDDIDFVMTQKVTPKLNPYYPIPSTPLYLECLKNNYFEKDNKFILRGEYAPMNTPQFPREDLNELLQSFFAVRLVMRLSKEKQEISEEALIRSMVSNNLIDKPHYDGNNITIAMYECDCKDIPHENGYGLHCKAVAERLARAFSLVSDNFYTGKEIKCDLKGFCTFDIIRAKKVEKNQKYILERLRSSLQKYLEAKKCQNLQEEFLLQNTASHKKQLMQLAR